jgi:hypothetical protein
MMLAGFTEGDRGWFSVLNFPADGADIADEDR